MTIEYKALVVEFRDGRRKRNEKMLIEDFGCKILDFDQPGGYFVLVPTNKVKELRNCDRLGSVEDFYYDGSKKSV
jgi:hypothetical protein